MNIRNRIADWVFKNTTFPTNVKSGNELSWMFKDNCPCCIAKPIEWLSNEEYHKKYPAEHKLVFGDVKIYLCEKHFNELTKDMAEAKRKFHVDRRQEWK